MKLNISGSSRRGSHRLALVKECPRKHFLRMSGWESKKEVDYRVGGSMIHAGLAWFFARYAERTPPWHGKISYLEAISGACDGQKMDLAPRVSAAVKYTLDYFHKNGLDRRILSVEHEYEASLGAIAEANEINIHWDDYEPGIRDEVVTSRTDIVHAIGGGVAVVDHKSTLQPLRGRGGDHTLSWQFLLQNLILRTALKDKEKVLPSTGVLRICWGKELDAVFSGVVLHKEHLTEALDLALLCVTTENRFLKIYEDAKVEAGDDSRDWGTIALGVPGFFWSCRGRYGPCDFIQACANPREFHRRLEATCRKEEDKGDDKGSILDTFENLE